MIKSVASAALLLAATFVLPAQAGDAENGEALSQSKYCISCHGYRGVSQLGKWPNLAGQREAYLVGALKEYRDGKRGGPNAAAMEAMATDLSDDEIADLAAFYAGLEWHHGN